MKRNDRITIFLAIFCPCSWLRDHLLTNMPQHAQHTGRL